MDKDSVKAFAKAIGTTVETITSQGWANCKCPLAPWTHDSGKDSSPSFAIKIDPNGESRFQCYACHKGDLLLLVQMLREFGAQAPKYDLKLALQYVNAENEQDLVLKVKDYGEKLLPDDDGNNDATFPEAWLHSFKKALTVPVALTYLKSRGLSPGLIKELDIRFDQSRQAVCFPIRDTECTLRGLRGRYIDPDEGAPPYHIYKNPEGHYNRRVWYGEEWVDFDKPVLMVESVFDLAAVFPIYSNVVAPLTVGMSKAKFKRVATAYDIVTLYDKGKGGDKARQLTQQYLPDALQVHLIPGGPHRFKPGEQATDPGEMTPVQLAALLRPHLPGIA